MNMYFGELASLGAALIWAFSLTLFARFGREFTPTALNLWKNAVALICFSVAVFVLSPTWPTQYSYYLAFALSGLLGLAIGDTALFGALQRLGAQNTSVTQCCVPLITASLAFVFLSETLSVMEVLGMFVTLVGIALVILHDRRQGFQAISKQNLIEGLVLTLVAALSQAGSVVIIRHFLQEVDIVLGTALRLFPAFLILALFAGPRGDLAVLGNLYKKKPKDLGIIAFAALFGTFLGLLLMSTGAKYAKAGISSALTATYPLWIIPLSAWIAKESISLKKTAYTLFAVLGVGLMMAA